MLEFVKRNRFWLRFAGVFLLIGLVLYLKIDLRETVAILANANFALIALSVALFAPFLASKAWRWRVILRDLGVATPFGEALRLYALGLGAAMLTPGQVGDAIKIAYFRDRGFGQSIISVVVDRLWDILILALLAATGALFFTPVFEGEWVFISAMLAGTVALFVFVTNPRTQYWLFRQLLRLRKSKDGVAYEPATFTLTQVSLQFGITVLATAIVYFRYYLMALSIGVALPPMPFVAAMSLATIAALLPISILGGVGARDAMLLLIAPVIGISGAEALAISSLIFLLSVVNGIVGFAVWLLEPRPKGAEPRLMNAQTGAVMESAGIVAAPAAGRTHPHLRVLMLTSSYPKFHGDTTAPFIESIAEHIAAEGVEVHVVLPEHRDLRRAPYEGGVHFHPFRYAPRRAWTMWGYAESMRADVELRGGAYLLAPLALTSAWRTALRVTGRERIDLIHAHWVIPNAPPAAFVARLRGVPLVISLHGSDVFVAERNRGMGAAARWCFDRAAAVTACSDELLHRALALGADENVTELIPYGADLKAFRVDRAASERVRAQCQLGAEDLLILGVGRLVSKKGFEYLIRAMPQVLQAVPHARLVLVGYGDLRETLERQAHDLGLNSNVVFVGRVAREDIPAYFGAADLVVVPSVHDAAGNVDGLPNVALEAMAAGKPLVASRVAGFPDVVREGENGFLVPEKDVPALAAAILQLAQDPALRARLGAAGRDLVRTTLNWENVAKRFIGLYARALRQGRAE